MRKGISLPPCISALIGFVMYYEEIHCYETLSRIDAMKEGRGRPRHTLLDWMMEH